MPRSLLFHIRDELNITMCKTDNRRMTFYGIWCGTLMFTGTAGHFDIHQKEEKDVDEVNEYASQ